MTLLRIAVLQTAGHPDDAEANLAELDAVARRTVTRGGALLITPELFATGYDIGDRAAWWADRPLLDTAAEIARRHGIGIVLGLPERIGDGVGNCAVLLDEHGDVRARHVKTHLFGELDGGRFRAGDRLVTAVDFHGVRIALLICYDVEFPESVRAAALAGAELIAVPTAQMEPYGHIADTVIPTRAWENQVYVAYANHVGREADTVYVGRSSVVAPDGAPLARAGEQPNLLVADMDTDVVAAARRANPYLTDRRVDLYPSAPAEGPRR